MSTTQRSWVSLHVTPYYDGSYGLSILRHVWVPFQGTRVEQLHTRTTTLQGLRKAVWDATEWMLVFDRIERGGPAARASEHHEPEQAEPPLQ